MHEQVQFQFANKKVKNFQSCYIYTWELTLRLGLREFPALNSIFCEKITGKVEERVNVLTRRAIAGVYCPLIRLISKTYKGIFYIIFG